MTTCDHRRPNLAFVLVGVAVLTAFYAVEAQPAAAHDDEGQMTVTAAEQAGPGRIRLEIGLVYPSDGHLAEEATVAASLTGAGGQVVGPVGLPRTSGSLYGAEIDVPAPGTWQVTVTATNPAATADAVVEVAAPTATSSPDGVTPDTVTPEQLRSDAVSPTTVARDTSTDDDDDGFPLGLMAAILVVAALVAGVVFWWYKHRRADTPD